MACSGDAMEAGEAEEAGNVWVVAGGPLGWGAVD